MARLISGTEVGTPSIVIQVLVVVDDRRYNRDQRAVADDANQNLIHFMLAMVANWRTAGVSLNRARITHVDLESLTSVMLLLRCLVDELHYHS